MRSHLVTNLPLAAIPGTEVRVVHSEVAQQDYLISVALPFHYGEVPGKNWPIYVLDANLYFGLVVDMVRAMNIRVDFCNELPDAFIVGIGYPVSGTLQEMLHQVMHLRLRDFVRTRSESFEQFIQEAFPLPEPVPSGNAEPFLRFVQQELVPMIEAEYLVDPSDRTLLGHSWGADFALYALFQRPTLFQRYVVASPEPNLDDEQAYAARHDSLPVRLHLVVEDMQADEVTRLESFAALLESRGYAVMTLTHQILAQTTHCAMVPPAFQSGLVAVFP
jgi:predicted alpha/beta superfamily hydrolase